MQTQRRALLPADPFPSFSRFLRLALAGMAIPGLAAGALAAAHAASKAPASFKIVSGPKCVEGEPATDEATTFAQGVVFTARPLPAEEWEARLERLSPGLGHLFRGLDGSPAPFQVFLLKVESKSKELVRFQPGNILRVGGENEEDHILDYTDLYRYLQGIGKAGEDLDPMRDGFFDSGMILEAGKPVERLLFFHSMPPSKKRKAMALLFSSFQVGSETYRAGLAWHFEKVK
jgi:hypothetical protein